MLVAFSSLSSGVCTVAASTVTGVAAGTCIVAANQSGNSSYRAAPQVSRSFPVTAVPPVLLSQSISFVSAPNSLVVGGTGIVSATATSGLAVAFGSLSSGVCTVAGSTVTGVAAGTCVIAASQAGSGSYLPASQITRNFQVTAAPGPPPVAANYEGLWWRAPAGSESGWGINFAHQGDVIFATWFTYDLTGKAWWLTMTAEKTAENLYTGTLFETRGPAFNAVPFSPAAVTASAVGSGTLTFSDMNNGSFAYSVNGITQTKTITRQVFGPMPTCTFGAQPNLALATNYQDLWWGAPAGDESGWGVNFTHQGDIIFATWFTYDIDGTPMWLSATTPKTELGVYAGTLYRTIGPAFNAMPFLPRDVVLTPVGTLTITFANGNSATYAYRVTLPGGGDVVQTKTVTRQVFRLPGTVCQ